MAISELKQKSFFNWGCNLSLILCLAFCLFYSFNLNDNAYLSGLSFIVTPGFTLLILNKQGKLWSYSKKIIFSIIVAFYGLLFM